MKLKSMLLTLSMIGATSFAFANEEEKKSEDTVEIVATEAAAEETPAN